MAGAGLCCRKTTPKPSHEVYCSGQAAERHRTAEAVNCEYIAAA
jgi:hypothetical protein